jgi:ROK family
MPASPQETSTGIAGHGDAQLTSVIIDTYNAEMRDKDGFIGDRASRRAFAAIIDSWRKRLRKDGIDPLGDADEDLKDTDLVDILSNGTPEASGLVLSAIEEFAQEFVSVIRRFLRLKDWLETERIVIGGGFCSTHISKLVIGRASVILKAEDRPTELVFIRNHPDEAGLIGCIHLAPPWIFGAHNAVLAVDIGGSNIRAGVVGINASKDPTLAKSKVLMSEVWTHADDKPTREEAVEKLVLMLTTLIKRAEKEGLNVAPFIGIGCPGIIQSDGSIEKGGQNLPGNWESKRFHLPQALREAIPTINGHDTSILMHNDAIVQGLSEAPFMQDVTRWGVMTIGTGLGNARFTNRQSTDKK